LAFPDEIGVGGSSQRIVHGRAWICSGPVHVHIVIHLKALLGKYEY